LLASLAVAHIEGSFDHHLIRRRRSILTSSHHWAQRFSRSSSRLSLSVARSSFLSLLSASNGALILCSARNSDAQAARASRRNSRWRCVGCPNFLLIGCCFGSSWLLISLPFLLA